MADGIIATVLDPDGRRVALSEDPWAHIAAGPELRDFRESILEAVRAPHGGSRVTAQASSGSTGPTSAPADG